MSPEPTTEATPEQSDTSTTQIASCPHCQTEFPIHPAQSNQAVACPGCFQRIELGKDSTTPHEPATAEQPHPSTIAQPGDESAADVEPGPAAAEAGPADAESFPTPQDASEADADETAEHREFLVQDGPRTIQVGGKVVALHTRTREEKSQLRFRKNMFMLFASVVVLIVVLVYLGGVFSDKSPTPPERPATPDSSTPSGESDRP